MRIADAYSREEIISIWLQSVYLGRNCYGLVNTTETLLDIEFSDAGMREFLTVLSLAVAPSRLTDDPVRHAESYTTMVQEGVEVGLLSPDAGLKLGERGPQPIQDTSCTGSQ